MRQPVDAARIRSLLEFMGSHATEPATVYLTGGATAVLVGWRRTTIDVDMRLEPESDSILRELPTVKDDLAISIELASPLDFLPEPPGWRDRSPFVAQEGSLTVRHMDPYAQVLAKLERGLDHDLEDCVEMRRRGMVADEVLLRLLEEIAPFLYRFPAVDPPSFRKRVEAFAGHD